MHALILDNTSVVFGGEGNGGLIFPAHQFCRDGGMTAATMVSILASEGMNLSDLVARLPKRFMIKEKVKTSDAPQVMKRLKKVLSGEQIDKTDGLKIIRGSTWALVRASGTEPLIRIIVESDHKTSAETFFGEIKRSLGETLP
jgi:phosphomannomutase/phosphoglucomutase